MRYVLKILLLLGAFYSSAQTLTDVSASQNITAIQSTSDHFGNGMSFYDFNQDGWDDLTIPARNDSVTFYVNNNGTYNQISSYLYSIGNMRQIIWVDYDNNGILDLCASYSDFGVRLYQNDGNFNFTDVTSSSGISTTPSGTYGISFADSDNDGDLDLYVCNYEALNYVAGAIPNQFYENLGNGTFNEIASLAGIDNGLSTSFIGSWFDYNNDNKIDLHLINDRFPFKDALYKNNGNNIFTDEANTFGIENNGHNPMNSSISDYNNDGNEDIFITDIANGNIVNGVPLDYKLFKRQSGTSFTNVAPAMGLDTNLYAWGAVWVDYDNDGFEDLYVATSYIDTINNTTASSLLFHNDAGLNFTLMNDSIFGNIVKSSYCPVKGDINNDGFYDIVVLNDAAPSNVLLNSGGNGKNFIKIIPVGTISNKMAIGAKVKVYAGGINQLQTVFCGSGFCAQNSQQMIFGLDEATSIDSLEIIFPSGIIAKQYDLDANEKYIIPEQATIVVDIISNVDTLILCQGDSISIGSTGFTDYLWNTGSTNPVITVSSPGTFQYQATSVGNDSIIQSNSLTLLFESTPIYQELIMDPICGIGNYGEIEIVFNNPADTNNTILWPDGSNGLYLDSIVPGTYTYTITSQNSCIYTHSYTVSEPISFNTVCITHPATDSELGSAEFFTWGGVPPFNFIMNGNSVGATIQNLIPGEYEVIITDAVGCIDTLAFIINDEITTGTDELSVDDYKIYQANEQLYICSENGNIQPSSVSVLNMSGKKVLDNEWNQKDMHCIYWTCELPTGIYQVKIEGDNITFSKSIFIQ